MGSDVSLEELLRRLTPLVQSIVTATVQQALTQATQTKVVPGVVVQVDGATANVRMDDGGIVNADNPGIVPCTRLGSGVTVGSRVLVVFFPQAGAAVALSVTGT